MISEEQEVSLATRKTKGAKGGGTIRQRPDGRWEARYTLGIDPGTGKQIQKSVYGKTQKEVRQKLTAITAEIDEGTYMDVPRLKTADWLNTWVEEYIGNVKPATRKSYQDHVRLNIIPYVGAVPLSKLTAAMIQQMYNELQIEKGLSPKTIKNVHALKKQQIRQQRWAARLNDGWENSDNLVFTTETGRYLCNQTVYLAFKKVMRRLHLDATRFHDLRHTYAVNSLKSGDDIKTVQENLGHQTAAFTLDVYAHATSSMKHESANRMDQYIHNVTKP